MECATLSYPLCTAVSRALLKQEAAESENFEFSLYYLDEENWGSIFPLKFPLPNKKENKGKYLLKYFYLAPLVRLIRRAHSWLGGVPTLHSTSAIL